MENINAVSINNKLIVEPYKKESLKATTSNGFSMVSQKVMIKGLKLIIDAKLNDGTVIEKGTVAHIKEEFLHSNPLAQKTFKSDILSEDFLIVDLVNVEFFSK
jgi:hypothetical protein